LQSIVYIGKTADPKKLKPVKYTDEGHYYAVHRVLDGVRTPVLEVRRRHQ